MLNRFLNLIKKITPNKWHWVLENEGYKRYFANTGWMFGGKFITIGIAFFVGVYVARYLGPSNYGLLSYVISFVGLFSFLSSFGIDSIVSREIIKDNDKKDEIIGTGFYIKIFGSLIAILSVFIVSFFLTNDPFILLLVWLFSLGYIPQAFNILEAYFQSQVLSKRVVKAQVVSIIISTILKISCVIFEKGIFWLIIIQIFETLIYVSFLIFSYIKSGGYIKKWKFNLIVAKSLLKDSWPLMFASVAIGIYMKIDQVMIKNILGNEQAGIYAIVVKLSEFWYFVPMIMCASLFPAIVNAMRTDNDLFKERMKKLYFLMFWFSTIIITIVMIFSYKIIMVLFGLPYISAVATIKIYVWAGISVSLGIASSQYLLATNMTKIFFFNTLLGAVINVILNLILIPKMGINGAAVATLFSYTVSTLGIFILKKSRNQGLLMLKSIVNYK